MTSSRWSLFLGLVVRDERRKGTGKDVLTRVDGYVGVRDAWYRNPNDQEMDI